MRKETFAAMRRRGSALALPLAVLLAVLCAPGASGALISFSGPYAPANWTLNQDGGDGGVDTSGAPTSIWLWGSDTWSGASVDTLFSITVPSNITWDFLWRYHTADMFGPTWDTFGYSIDGVFTQLSSNAGPNSQTGSVIGLSLLAGQNFAFYVDAIDDTAGRAKVNISGVPEPATLLMVGAGLGLAALLRRRR
jgi:hypothetical protein